MALKEAMVTIGMSFVGIAQISMVGLRLLKSVVRKVDADKQSELTRSVRWDCDIRQLKSQFGSGGPKSELTRSVRWDCDEVDVGSLGAAIQGSWN